MRDIHHVIEEYRRSDLAKRVYLFVEFRELRGEFSEIDRKEGFIGNKSETSAVTAYPSGVKMIGRTLIGHLKEWRHRLKGAFQGSI